MANLWVFFIFQTYSASKSDYAKVRVQLEVLCKFMFKDKLGEIIMPGKIFSKTGLRSPFVDNVAK